MNLRRLLLGVPVLAAGVFAAEPSAPVLSPLGVSETGNYSVVWTDVGAPLYELQEASEAAFTAPVSEYPTEARRGYSDHANGVYFYRVRGWTAPSASGGISGPWSGTESMRVEVDRSAPVISGLSFSVYATSASVRWTTDDPARGQVFYGPTAALGGATPLEGTFSSSHEASLAGLSAGTEYHLQVRSRDVAGNLATLSSLLTTEQRLGAVISPLGVNATGRYTVSWGALPWAVLYEIQEALDPSFSSPRLSDRGPQTRWEALGRDEGTYYYRVRGWTADPASGGEAGEWGPVASASVQFLRPDPALGAGDASSALLGARVTLVTPEPALNSWSASARGFVFDFNTGSSGWTGAGLSFDDFSTPGVESADLRALPRLVVGLRGDVSRVKLEVIDAAGAAHQQPLLGIPSGMEGFYGVPLASVADSIDLSRVRFIYFIVEGNGLAGRLEVNLFPVDAVDPMVSLDSPPENIWVTGPVEVSASASDARGVSRVVFTVPVGGPVEILTPPYRFTWDPAATAPGAHVVSAAAHDLSGRTASDAATVFFSPTVTPSSLDPLDVTDGAGAAWPVLITPDPANASAVEATPRGVRFSYDTFVGGWSAGGYSFDDPSTPGVETRDLSGLPTLVFGLRGDASALKWEMVDDQGRLFVAHLTGVSATAETVYSFSPSAVFGGVDISRVRSFHFVVEGADRRGVLEILRIMPDLSPVALSPETARPWPGAPTPAILSPMPSRHTIFPTARGFTSRIDVGGEGWGGAGFQYGSSFDFSSESVLQFGVLSGFPRLKLEVIDAAGRRFIAHLSGLSGTEERFYSLPLAPVGRAMDLTQVRWIYLIVEGGGQVGDLAMSIRPPLAAPSASAPAAPRSADYTLSWGAVPGAAVYEVEEARPPDFSAVLTHWVVPGTSLDLKGRVNGLYHYRVRAWSGIPGAVGSEAGPWSLPAPVAVDHPPLLVPASPGGQEIWLLNCGADHFEFTEPSGRHWMRDEPFQVGGFFRWGFETGFAALQTSTPIAGAAGRDAVFQTHRWGPADRLHYKIEVPNGSYEVKLLFAETYHDRPGARVFDVALEFNTVMTDHDVFAERGAFTADEHVFTVNVNDQQLDVTFPRAAVDSPMISGIEVRPLSLSDENFLDFIERKMFWFFWNETNPATGLISDREENFMPGVTHHASVASTGYGLSLLTIGAERGWITHEMALARIHATLDAFESAAIRNVRGFWYHFMNLDGTRSGTSEVSSVDSSLFIMGALQAGEYYRSRDPGVAAKAQRLYERMDWTWWLNRTDTPGNPSVANNFNINMSWAPDQDDARTLPNPDPAEGGYFDQYAWDAYNETVFVNLMALGSPTHPITDSRTWNDMRRPWIERNGRRFMHHPALFTHQYHHLYFDFRDKHDGFANYLDNTRDSTYWNREFSQGFPSLYGPHRWGLSASDMPNGGYTAYGADPDGEHDGTVAITAAVTSVFVTPEISIPAARHMYFQYKQDIWGRHGFSDSFNVAQKFAAPFSLSLDNGPMAIAIENYRTGLVRDTFMRSPYAQAGLAAAGFKGYDVEPLYQASSAESGETAPRFAFDGDFATRWASAFTDDEWLRVDYGRPRALDRVTLHWETAYGLSYRIQVSGDGVNWSDVFTTSSGNGGVDVVTFNPVSARFLRIKGDRRGTGWGYSLLEVEVGVVSPPALSFLAPSEGDTVSGAVTVSVDATAGAGVDRVVFFVDDVPLSTVTAAPYQFIWDASSYSQAVPHVLAAVLHDAAGGVTRVERQVFKTGPAASLGRIPGWQGAVLLDGESLSNWSVETDRPAGATVLALDDGFMGKALRFPWGLDGGNWMQAKYTFPAPVDLSAWDILGVSFRGQTGAPENRVRVLLADDRDVFYAYTLGQRSTSLGRWAENFPIPLKGFKFAWGPQPNIDWRRINRIFFTVERVNGGDGTLWIDHVQADRAADWPRPSAFEAVSGDPAAAARAVDYLLSEQFPTGLIRSWKPEPSPTAVLYDQSVALLALTRAGVWSSSTPSDAPAQAASRIAVFLVSAQKPDGVWARSWNPETAGEVTPPDYWVGDIGWAVMALKAYAVKSGDGAALSAAERAVAWIVSRMDPATGRVVDSTEGNVDAWWALTAMRRWPEAARLRDFLLSDAVHPTDLKFWWRGYNDPYMAMDVNTWPSLFARYPTVNRPEMGLNALGFLHRAMIARSNDGSRTAFDGMGPLSVWNEGSAQYVAAGGPDAGFFLGELLAQQRPDGSMPNSPDDWNTDYGWLTSWSGVAPTTWLYFALTGHPFDAVQRFTASSALQTPELAFDGNFTTRWESLVADPQWLQMDLGAPVMLNHVSIDWEGAYARAYSVEVSTNGVDWAVVFSTSSGDGNRDEVYFPTAPARFVRMTGTERATPWAYSIYEMRADFDPGVVVPGLSVPAESPAGDYQVSWTAVPGAVLYELQESTFPAFDVLSDQRWPAGVQEDFAGRADGDYFYRVRAWNALPASGGTAGPWSPTTSVHVGAPASPFFALIGPSGGVGGTLSGAHVDISPGVLSAAQRVGVEPLSLTNIQEEEARRQGLSLAGAAASYTVNGSSGYSFPAPVEISLPVVPSLVRGKTPVVAYWDESASRWQALPAADVSMAAGAPQVRARVDHFTVFAVFTALSIDDNFRLGEVFIYPNPAEFPARPIVHVEAGAAADRVSVAVYDLSGRQVLTAELSGAPQAGVNGALSHEVSLNSANLASGSYVAVINAHRGGATLTTRKKFSVLK